MLNWRFTDQSRFDAIPESERHWNDAFIWMCLALDMRSITQENVGEWIWRWNFYSRVIGPSYWRVGTDGKRGGEYLPTRLEVEARIGLETNCSQKTRRQFVDRLVRSFEQQLEL